MQMSEAFSKIEKQFCHQAKQNNRFERNKEMQNGEGNFAFQRKYKRGK